MTLRTDLEHRDDCLVLRAAGEWDPVGARKALRGIIDMCLREGITKVLIDTRAVTGDVSILDRSEIGKVMAAARQSRIAFAVVCREERVTPERFLQLVAQNRGGLVKVVTDPTEGLFWLSSLDTPARSRRERAAKS